MKYPILDKKSIDKLCSLIRESHSVADAIDDSGTVSTNTTFSSVKIQKDLQDLENNTETKISQAIRDALGSEKAAKDEIDSWF